MYNSNDGVCSTGAITMRKKKSKQAEIFDLIYKIQLALKIIATQTRMERPMIPAITPPTIVAVLTPEDRTAVDVG
jgi:hypothetical protein